MQIASACQGEVLQSGLAALRLRYDMFDVKSRSLKTLMHEAVLASSACARPGGPRQSFQYGHLGPLAQNLQSLPAHERRPLAQFNQRFEFFSFRLVKTAFVVAVHECLKATFRLRRKVKFSNGFYPVHRGRNRWAHGIMDGRALASMLGPVRSRYLASCIPMVKLGLRCCGQFDH